MCWVMECCVMGLFGLFCTPVLRRFVLHHHATGVFFLLVVVYSPPVVCVLLCCLRGVVPVAAPFDVAAPTLHGGGLGCGCLRALFWLTRRATTTTTHHTTHHTNPPSPPTAPACSLTDTQDPGSAVQYSTHHHGGAWRVLVGVPAVPVLLAGHPAAHPPRRHPPPGHMGVLCGGGVAGG